MIGLEVRASTRRALGLGLGEKSILFGGRLRHVSLGLRLYRREPFSPHKTRFTRSTREQKQFRSILRCFGGTNNSPDRYLSS